MSTTDMLIVYTLGLILAIGAGAGASYYLFDKLAEAAEVPCKAPEGVQQGWQPPPLELCPDDMELWDCIRNAAYRSDI